LCYLWSIFKQRLGNMGTGSATIAEKHIWIRAQTAIDFGADLRANFGLARFINIRSKFLHSSLSSRQSMGSNPYSG